MISQETLKELYGVLMQTSEYQDQAYVQEACDCYTEQLLHLRELLDDTLYEEVEETVRYLIGSWEFVGFLNGYNLATGFHVSAKERDLQVTWSN